MILWGNTDRIVGCVQLVNFCLQKLGVPGGFEVKACSDPYDLGRVDIFVIHYESGRVTNSGITVEEIEKSTPPKLFDLVATVVRDAVESLVGLSAEVTRPAIVLKTE